MPAVRSTKYAADFQDIPSDPTRVKCLVCSAASDLKDTIVLRSGRSEHLTRRKHVDAVAEQARLVASSLESRPALPVAAAAPPARFKMSDILESESEEDEDQPQRVHSPVDGILMDGSRFFDRDRNELLFSARTVETSAAQRRELLEGIRNLDYYDHTVFGKVAREDTTVSEAVAAMVDMDLNSDLESEPEYTLNDDALSPHGSKTASLSAQITRDIEYIQFTQMFMLDLLDNLPRLRLSDDQLKTIIWVMRECKTPDVPSFSALRKKQAELTKDVNIGTRHHVSALGNEFFMNHPAELLALDFANPLVRKYMHVYPEVTDRISEFNHAEKWTKEIDHDDLSPMWAGWENSPHKHFYIKELAQLKNGEYFVPTRWVISTKRSVLRVIKSVTVPSDLKYNYLDLKHAVNSITFTDSSPDWAQSMPNPVRKIAKGRPVFSVRIIPWSDDVSGNDKKIKGDPRKAIKIRIKDHIQWQLYSWVLLQPADRVEKLPRNSRKQDSTLTDGSYDQEITSMSYFVFESYSVTTSIFGMRRTNNMSLRARYIVKYKNGLTGKHFKILQQLGIFHLHNDLCGDNLFNLWKAAGELGALLWFPEICNQAQYLAPSHDIAVTLADRERFKHQVSGGWWKATDSQSYTQAGRKRRLGWTDKMKPKPGTTKLAPRRTSLSAQWAEILGPIWTPELNAYGAGKVWTTCKFVVAQSGDVCAKDSFVFFKCKVGNQNIILLKDTGEVLTGRICMILIPATATTSHDQAAVVIRKFVVAAERDSRLNMPRMASSAQTHVVTPAVFFKIPQD
ncbi:hypothetical protein R3P38DRAFT_3452691 [Favolaschia claudopus]|uniref:Uncharacterized protein n=1 Tax=Favolaschia claudopus TaxID=2862362 RepID=A0AAV9ZJE5_9AGAR